MHSILARFTSSTSARPLLKYLPSPLLKWVVRSRGFVVGSTRFVVLQQKMLCKLKGLETGEKQAVGTCRGISISISISISTTISISIQRRTNVDVMGVGKHTHASTRLATDP